MSFLSGLGKAFHSITSIVDKVTSFLKAPLEAITKPIQGLMDKVLDKLPFGLGNLVKPFADKFLSMGINWLAAGPLGGLMSTLSTVAGVAGKVDDVLHTVDGALNGGIASLPDPAKANAQNAFAFTQAQELLG